MVDSEPAAAAPTRIRGERERLAVGANRTASTTAAGRVLSPSGTTLSAWPTAAGSAGLLAHIHEHPLVVVSAPVVDANRFVLALASYASQAAGHRAARRTERGR